MQRCIGCVFLALLLSLSTACNDDSSGGNNADAQDAAQDVGADATSTDTEVDSESSQHCPTETLPSQTTVTYGGSTVGNDNLFESNRLEWDDAGDDALLYVVPEAGTYEFAMDDDLTDNSGCGISVRNPPDDFHSPTNECPAEGQVMQLPDAYFVATESSTGTVDLTQDQELLVLISCSYWSSPTKEIDYTLTITKQ